MGLRTKTRSTKEIKEHFTYIQNRIAKCIEDKTNDELIDLYGQLKGLSFALGLEISYYED